MYMSLYLTCTCLQAIETTSDTMGDGVGSTRHAYSEGMGGHENIDIHHADPNPNPNPNPKYNPNPNPNPNSDPDPDPNTNPKS